MKVLETINLRDILLAQGESLALVITHPAASFRDGGVSSADSLLLRVLSHVTGVLPDKLRIEKTSQGKPYLAPEGFISFSVSHSRSYSLIALSLGDVIGCDIEGRFQHDDARRLGPLLLHAAELESMRELEHQDLHEAFMRCWVRKEALLKAKGTGFGLDPRDVLVGFGDAPAALFDPQGWELHLHDGPLVAGNMTAVASEDQACTWHLLDN